MSGGAELPFDKGGTLPPGIRPVASAPRPSFWSRAKKFGVACIGAAGQVFTQGLIPDPWAGRVAIALALATAFGVYQVRNATSSSSSSS